ncbi:MAG: hypothetical protein WBQ23_13250 [Bacteroidota bacterium]
MRYSYSLSAILFFLLTIIPACSESDPVTPQEEHYDAIGVVLRSSGTQEASILRGVTADTLDASAGSLGELLEVFFYDENEHIIEPPTDPNKTLSWEIGNRQLLELQQDSGREGRFEFRLKGLQSGATTIELFIMHEGHADYRSGKIPVSIH